MTCVSSVKELNKFVRKHLIAQSDLPSAKVLNALSIYGDDLDKMISEHVYESIDQSDSLLLFELNARDSSSDVSFDEGDSIIYYKSYKLSCIIYGNSCSDVANKLIARFRTEPVRDDLQNDGIKLESVSHETTLNEYKNNSMWTRSDFDINLDCKFKISKRSDDVEIKDFSETVITRR